jgi:predicted enzyme related to lactoylglutathione lyase
MTTRTSAWEPGTPCWVDLGTPDRDAAGMFYTGLFGWELTDHGPELGSYVTASVDGRPVAGIAPLPEDMRHIASTWTTYLATDDVDAATDRATKAGGSTIFPPVDIAGQGRSALVADPTGAPVGRWQAGEHIGMRLANEPGSVSWNECMTRDFTAAQEFYTAVFGYDWFDMSGDGFTYAAFMVGGRSVGGLGELDDSVPGDVPSHWATYFKVADAAAAAATVLELGGSVLREPWETPFGTMCTVADRSGAPFSLMADTAQAMTVEQAQRPAEDE